MSDFTLPGEIVLDGIHMPGRYFPRENLDQIPTFKMCDRDTLIATYPKSGTIWVSEIAYLISTDFNFELAKTEIMTKRIPFLELGTQLGSGIDVATANQGPRVMRSHMPFKFFSKQILEDKTKVIVVQRNPKDVLVSFYNMYKANEVFGYFDGNWDDFLELFYAKKLAFGDWFDVNNSWWQQRHLTNILFIKYEDLKADIESQINKITTFMGKEISAENMVKLKEHVKFDSMQANPTVTPKAQNTNICKFYRKGEVGDWKNHFTVAQNEKFDEEFMHKIEETGMSFRYE